MKMNRNDKIYIASITIISIFLLSLVFFDKNDYKVINEGNYSMGVSSWSVEGVNTTAEYSIDGNISNNLSEYYNFIQGSGTQTDPYILADFEANSTHGFYNIYIKNIKDYFHITNLTLHNVDSGYSNIRIRECSNIKIYNNNFNAIVGNIEMVGCANSSIYNNTIISKPYYFLDLFVCKNITISNNRISTKYEGIQVFSSSDIIIESNDLIDNGRVGVSLHGAHNVQIIRNNFKDNQNGIELRSSIKNLIDNNNFTNNKKLAIKLEWSSEYNIITSNNIRKSQYAIKFGDKSANNILSNNIITNIYIKPIKFWIGDNVVVDNVIKQSFWGVLYIFTWCMGATTLVTYLPYYLVKKKKKLKEMIESYHSKVNQKERLGELETELNELKEKYFELSKKVNFS